MSNIPEHRLTAISLAIKRTYQDAEINLEELNPGVVPLYDLIRSYPIWVEEIFDMTSQKIEEILKTKTGQKFTIAGNDNQKLAGYLYLQEFQGEFYGCILVEKRPSAAPISRRRFSAAHELGHYLLHFLPLLEQNQQVNSDLPLILSEVRYVNEGGESKENSESEYWEIKPQFITTNGLQEVLDLLNITEEQMEEEADRFAAEVLMPEKACFALAQRYCGRFGKKRDILAGRLAPEFLVSKQAMKRRLFDLKLPEILTKS